MFLLIFLCKLGWSFFAFWISPRATGVTSTPRARAVAEALPQRRSPHRAGPRDGHFRETAEMGGGENQQPVLFLGVVVMGVQFLGSFG